jgi:hypothetical protein
VSPKIIYIAGRYRGDKSVNALNFQDAARRIFTAGHMPLNPIANTVYLDGEFSDDDFISRDLLLVGRCDGVYLLQGWETSVGARRELEHAMSLEIPASENLSKLLREIDYLDAEYAIEEPPRHPCYCALWRDE